MSATPKSNVRAVVKTANGSQRIYTLEELSKLQLAPKTQVTLVDQTTGKSVGGLLAKRQGMDLVFELEEQGDVVNVG